jgi:hypothetical protein
MNSVSTPGAKSTKSSDMLLISACPMPTKKEKESFLLMLKYYCANFAVISPLLPFVTLWDENEVPIDSRRERIDQFFKV